MAIWVNADEIIERLKWDFDEEYAKNIVEDATSFCADMVEVVRCKDCRYRIHDEVTNEWFCNSFHSGFVYAKPNDFCSYGERICHDKN